MGVPDTRCAGVAPLLVVAVLAGCGETDREPSGAPAEGKRGGTLIALWAGDTDNIDPGITYAQHGTQIVRATQKTLYRPKVDDATVTEPDLAATDPQISADGCRVTVTAQARRPVLAAGQPERDVGGRQVRHRARVLRLGQQRLCRALLRQPAGREGGRRARDGDPRDHDSRRPHGRVRPRAPTGVEPLRRRHPRRRAVDAAVGAGAAGERAGVRRQAGVHVRRPSGRNRSVHDRERPVRNDGRLRPRAAHPARPQPELERAARHPSGLRRRDRDPPGQRRRHGDVAARPRRREHDQRRPATPADGPAERAGRAQGPDPARAERRRPLDRAEHHDPALRRRRRAPRGDRRLRPRGHAAHLRRRGERRHPDPLPPARHPRLRRGGRPPRARA